MSNGLEYMTLTIDEMTLSNEDEIEIVHVISIDTESFERSEIPSCWNQ